MEKKKTVTIDMDGTLVDFDTVMTEKVSKALKIDLMRVDNRTYSFEETISKCANITVEQAEDVMSSIWNEEGFWDSLPAYQGSIEVVTELSKFCNIFACTRIPKYCPNAFIEKQWWIIEHFPDIQVEFFAVSNGAKKTRIKCDYIIEDRLKEIKSCPPETVAIVINRPWNRNECVEWSEDLVFTRVNNWNEIPAIILGE